MTVMITILVDNISFNTIQKQLLKCYQYHNIMHLIAISTSVMNLIWLCQITRHIIFLIDYSQRTNYKNLIYL